MEKMKKQWGMLTSDDDEDRADHIARGGAAQSKILNSYEGPPAIRTILHSINLMHMLLSLWGAS